MPATLNFPDDQEKTLRLMSDAVFARALNEHNPTEFALRRDDLITLKRISPYQTKVSKRAFKPRGKR